MAKNVACAGFRFAGLSCGIKTTPKFDLGLIVAEKDIPTAAVFTRNQVRAAPVELSERNVKSGLARAIIVNSGNANACTGPRGESDAQAMAHYASKAIGCSEKRILVASTGIIGQPLPVGKIVEATPRLTISARADGLENFTRAIMTTDRFEKRALELVAIGPKSRGRIVGVAKGAGMISPNMATTLGFLVTDVAVTGAFLKSALRDAVDDTFNCASVDGDTSTNDSVFVMASGALKNRPIDGGKAGEEFKRALHTVLDNLIHQIVRDGEGANHVVTIEVMGAPGAGPAETIARAIGRSPLVKTAFFGTDPNWGRIVCAIGNAGVKIDPSKIDVAVGEVELVRAGVGVGPAAESAAHEVMRRGEYSLRVHLHGGSGKAKHITCDMGTEYVKLNADYRS